MSVADRFDELYTAERHPFGQDIREVEGRATELLQMTDRDVLDLGAGDGRVARHLAQQGNQVMALDVSSVALQTLVQEAASGGYGGRIEAHKIDLNDTSALNNLLAGRQFDVLLMMDVMHFLDDETGQAILDEVNKHMRDEGEFVIRGPLPSEQFRPLSSGRDRAMWKKAELNTRVQRAGFIMASYNEFQWNPAQPDLDDQLGFIAVLQKSHHLRMPTGDLGEVEF